MSEDDSAERADGTERSSDAVSRRRVLRAGTAAATGLTGLTAASGTAAAADGDVSLLGNCLEDLPSAGVFFPSIDLRGE
ncbi:MAG: hypothetical protein ABEJ31_14270 [Haloarculaceae archaeon]